MRWGKVRPELHGFAEVATCDPAQPAGSDVGLAPGGELRPIVRYGLVDVQVAAFGELNPQIATSPLAVDQTLVSVSGGQGSTRS